MTTKISYFDFPGGRGEDCRLALHIAGVDFEDDRIKGPAWGEMKAGTPMGKLPVLTIDGRQVAQSNAILAYLGREHGLHPADAFEAARHESVMMYVEDFRAQIAQDTSADDEDDKREKRIAFADGYMNDWAERVERQIAGPFFAGDDINVVDLKISGLIGWFKRGGVDHIGADYFDRFPKLTALYDAVHSHERVADWYAD